MSQEREDCQQPTRADDRPSLYKAKDDSHDLVRWPDGSEKRITYPRHFNEYQKEWCRYTLIHGKTPEGIPMSEVKEPPPRSPRKC